MYDRVTHFARAMLSLCRKIVYITHRRTKEIGKRAPSGKRMRGELCGVCERGKGSVTLTALTHTDTHTHTITHSVMALITYITECVSGLDKGWFWVTHHKDHIARGTRGKSRFPLRG